MNNLKLRSLKLSCLFDQNPSESQKAQQWHWHPALIYIPYILLFLKEPYTARSQPMYPKHGDLQGSRNYWYFQEGYCQLVSHINSIHPSILVGPCSMYLGIKTVRPSLAWSRSKATSIPGSKPTPSPVSQLSRCTLSWEEAGVVNSARSG